MLWSSHLCPITPVESRYCEVEALQEEAAAAAVLFCQALGQRLQDFLKGEVSVTPRVLSLGGYCSQLSIHVLTHSDASSGELRRGFMDSGGREGSSSEIWWENHWKPMRNKQNGLS